MDNFRETLGAEEFAGRSLHGAGKFCYSVFTRTTLVFESLVFPPEGCEGQD
jgi:hypothetical protein